MFLVRISQHGAVPQLLQQLWATRRSLQGWPVGASVIIDVAVVVLFEMEPATHIWCIVLAWSCVMAMEHGLDYGMRPPPHLKVWLAFCLFRSRGAFAYVEREDQMGRGSIIGAQHRGERWNRLKRCWTAHAVSSSRLLGTSTTSALRIATC